MSRTRRWLSDALCRLATGGGFGARENYDNKSEVIFCDMRPLILAAIKNYILEGPDQDQPARCD